MPLRPQLRAIVAVLTLVTACRALAAGEEHPIGLMLVNQPYAPGAFEIQGETRDLLVVQYGYDEKYRKSNLTKRTLRYVIYPNHAIPYASGVARNRLGLERVVEHPYGRLRLVAFAGFAAGVWQGTEYWRARRDVRSLEAAKWSDAVVRATRDKRDDHASYTVYAIVGAAASWIVSMRTRRFVRLEDGTTFGFEVGF